MSTIASATAHRASSRVDTLLFDAATAAREEGLTYREAIVAAHWNISCAYPHEETMTIPFPQLETRNDQNA